MTKSIPDAGRRGTGNHHQKKERKEEGKRETSTATKCFTRSLWKFEKKGEKKSGSNHDTADYSVTSDF